MTTNIVASILPVSGTAPPPTDHNNLAGLQGGASGEYFHLTQEEYVVILELVEGQDRIDAINGDPGTIPVGTPVSVSSVNISTGQLTVVAYTGDSGLYVGVAGESILTTDTGIVVLRGLVTGMNTANLAAGQAFYLDETSGFTSDSLVGSIRVGICLSVDAATGEVQILDPLFSDEGPAVKWRGTWTPGVYQPYDQVQDSGVLAVANTTTVDRPSPQENGAATYDLPDMPSWSDESVGEMFIAGHEYTFTQSGWLRTIEVWTPVVAVNPPYRAFIVDITNPSVPISYPLPTFVGGQDQWQTLQVSNFFVQAGTILQIQLVSLLSDGVSSFSGPWVLVNTTLGDPAAGDYSKDTGNVTLKLAFFDDNGTDHTGDFAGMENGTIITLDNQSGTGTQEFLVNTILPAGTFYTFQVSLTSQSGSINIGDTVQFSFGSPAGGIGAEYVTIPDHWLGTTNDPEWGTVSGIEGAPASPTPTDDAYGIRISIQPALVSNDWDLQALGNGATPPASNPGFISTSYASVVNQVPAVDLTAQTIVFEVIDSAIPEFTMNVDGSFIFNTLGQALGNLLLTIGRGAAGQQESIWFWTERLASTGPDVWAPIARSVTRATTNTAVDSTSFRLSLPSIAPGDTYRFRMEAEDASELVGLYAEAAVGNHPEVASASLSFQIYK